MTLTRPQIDPKMKIRDDLSSYVDSRHTLPLIGRSQNLAACDRLKPCFILLSEQHFSIFTLLVSIKIHSISLVHFTHPFSNTLRNSNISTYTHSLEWRAISKGIDKETFDLSGHDWIQVERSSENYSFFHKHLTLIISPFIFSVLYSWWTLSRCSACCQTRCESYTSGLGTTPGLTIGTGSSGLPSLFSGTSSDSPPCG